MHSSRHIAALAVAASIAFGGFGIAATSAPAAARADCASNGNIWHVHRRLDGAIDQLNHDDHHYGGHRVNAINDLQGARNELVAAEQYAVAHDRDNPACVRARGPVGGSDVNWGLRAQRGSNLDMAHVRSWVETMIDQLQRDQHDYDGHRVNAIRDMENARNEITAAEGYARSRRY